MKSIRNIAFSALLAVGAFTTVTYTACTKDDCKDVVCDNGGTCVSGACNCPNYYSGATCQTEIRTTYYNTYIGDGTDSDGLSYKGYKIKFSARGTDAKNMILDVTDGNNVPMVSVNVMLEANDTYKIEQKTDGSDIITGSGSVTTSKATLTLIFTDRNDSKDVLTFNFNNMLKQ